MYLIYITAEAGNTAAIAYRLPTDKYNTTGITNSGIKASINYGLQSVILGPDAQIAHTTYKVRLEAPSASAGAAPATK